MAKSFEDLFIWQEARTLTNEVYNIVDKSNDYGFKEQIQRAVVSIMNNIAEGFESGSNATANTSTNAGKTLLNALPPSSSNSTVSSAKTKKKSVSDTPATYRAGYP